ncbi:MAG: hypothetical protein E6X17_09815 [Sporomusaceae bacterium]|nr:hypothetical protein [Sporomusaceae bacterium]
MRKIWMGILAVVMSCVIFAYAFDPTLGQANSQANSTCAGDQERAEQVQHSFYGKWEITRYLGSSAVASSDVKVEKMIGKQVAYYPDKAIFGTKEIINPVYRVITMSVAEFARGWKVNAKRIGIEGETIQRVRGNSREGRGGFGFFIKDDDTLIGTAGGYWFEMKRVE